MLVKRSKLLLLSILFLFVILKPAADQNSIIISTDLLNIRKEPGLSYPIIRTAQRGEAFSVLNQNGDWLQIELDSNNIGWVASWLVTANEKESIDKNQMYGSITVDGLRVRAGPGTNYDVISSLNEGDFVRAIAEQNGWLKIESPYGHGWISKDYIQLDFKKKMGTILATSLNVRDEGSLKGKIIGSVSKGQAFTILEEQQNWIKIEWLPNLAGWVAEWFVEKLVRNSLDTEAEVKKESVSISYNGTNIRIGPELSYDVVERANTGETFPLIDIRQNWFEIQLPNGESGFVNRSLATATHEDSGAFASPLEGKEIMIDPGHGGKDIGSTGVSGTIEKDLTLKVSELLFHKLKDLGANVSLTRNYDQFLSLSNRVYLAFYKDVDAFISIHFDSIEDPTVNGLTSYYYRNKHKGLAAHVHQEITAHTKLQDRGIRFGDYHVIRENKQSAVLLELGYLSNPTEELLVNRGDFQEEVTDGIVGGLINYFQLN